MARVKSSEEDVYYRNLQRKVSVEGTPEVFVRGMLDVRFYEVKSHEEKKKKESKSADGQKIFVVGARKVFAKRYQELDYLWTSSRIFWTGCT